MDDSVQGLKDLKSVKTFELKMDVRAAKVLKAQGENDYSRYPNWLLVKKRKNITPHRLSNNLAKTSEYIREFGNQLALYADPETAIGYQDKLISKKTNDGFNSIMIGATAGWYEIKTDVVINKYIRSVLKKEITDLYITWVLKLPDTDNKRIPKSQILPKALFDGLMEEYLDLETFMTKLHAVRLKADVSNGI